MNPLQRFSTRAEQYAGCRPSYPVEILDLLARECGLSANSVVADIGSGTGLSSKLFLDFGCEVFGVEPNPEMRRAGEAFLSAYPRFHSIAGQAESTSLPDASVDLVAAGQAFHWFDPPRARLEFRRILRGGGWIVLIWNERRVTDDPFLAGYEDLLHRHAPEYGKVDHRRIGPAELSSFFGDTNWRAATFDNAQLFDLEGLRGRVLSSSYTPPPGAPGHDAMMSDLAALFEATQKNGHITFAYETRVYWGAGS
ncbi:MAG TPA: class I SAM-dependent methyltransferase [Bryobacteraceae bacterium]|nr:class I SAM-dependent methyltransferase [Bryobacteraceae bacterium]